MMQGFSRPAKDFQTEALLFIKAEGFARFLDVVIELIESIDPDKVYDSNLRLNLRRLSIVMGQLERDVEVIAKGERYAKFSDRTKN